MWKSWNCSSRSWVFRSIARFHERSRKRERKGAGNEGILANLEKGKKKEKERSVASFPERFLFGLALESEIPFLFGESRASNATARQFRVSSTVN